MFFAFLPANPKRVLLFEEEGRGGGEDGDGRGMVIGGESERREGRGEGSEGERRGEERIKYLFKVLTNN